MTEDPRIAALPDIHGHAKGEHKPFAEERPIPYTARMLFLWFFHACRRGSPRFLMVADHMNYLTFEDPAAVNLVRRALKLAQAGDLYGAAETAGVEIGHAQVVGDGLRKGMRYSIGAEIDNDPRCRPDAQNIVDAMKPDGTVRSVHFIPITHPQHGENWMWAFDNPEFKDLYDVVGGDTVWEIYMTTLLDAIDKLPGNIVGHFYVPAKFGHWPADDVLETYEDRFVDACAERGMAIEVNSRYIYKYFVDDQANLEKFRAVHLRLLRKAKEKNVAIAVGSDAHSPKDQGGAFDAVLALLDEADVNEIAFPIAGRLARVALRATEEILRQHTAALAPSPLPPAEAPVDEDDEDEEKPAVAEPAPEPVAAAPKRKRPPPKSAAMPAEPPAVLAADTPVAEPQAAGEAPAAEPAAASEETPQASRDVKPAPKRARPKKAPPVLETADSFPAEVPVSEPAAAAADGAAPGATASAVVEPAVAEPPASEPAPVETTAEQPSEERSPFVAAAQAVIDSAVEAVAAVAARVTHKQPAQSKPVPSKPVTPKAAAPKPPAAKPPADKPATAAAQRAPKAGAAKPPVAKAPAAKAVAAKPAPAKPAAKSAPKKTASKKAAARPAAAKKSGPAKKAAPLKKAASKKPAAKKTAAKPAKKAAPSKAASRKPVAKKAAAKKPLSKKTVPKRAAAPVRKPAPKKAVKKAAKRRR